VLRLAGSLNHGKPSVFDQLQATIQSMHSSADGERGHARIGGGFRLPAGLDPDEFARLIQRLASRDIVLEVSGQERAYATDRNDPVVRAISSGFREHGARPRPKLKTGTADLNVVGPIWKCPLAAYGPGDSSLDHTPREHLSIGEYPGRSRS